MEQVEREMYESTEDQQKSIRKYLLGSLDDQAEMRRIEEKIMLEDNFAEQLSIAEDALIDEYLDGTLPEAECERFLHFFLLSPENREKLRFIKNLRQYAATRGGIQDAEQSSKEKGDGFDWRKLFSLPSFRFGGIVLLVLVVGFGIWRVAFYQSDVDQGLTQLQLAYRAGRPVEARIIGLNYAPLNETRGAADNETGVTRERAEGFLLHAAAEDRNDAALKALGKFYLTEKKFDKANEQFELSAALAPNDAQLQSDWGAALLEMGKKAAIEKDGAKSLESLDQSLKHLEKAILLDPKLPEPKFNRALCLQALSIPEQAKQAWRQYLETDASSQWAEEARRNLQILESQKVQERSAAKIEFEFLTAFKQKNEEEAWRLLSRNRELIREKYLPQRLAMSYLAASEDEKKIFLKALNYAGEIEFNHIGDPFAGELASFYATLPENKVALLNHAQQAIRNGYQLCLKLHYREALNEFQTARDLFLQTGDVWETNLGEYFIGYCLINIDRVDESLVQFNRIVEFSRNGNYKWLEATSLFWLASGFRNLKQRTESKINYEKALALAEEIKDSYAVQRNLLELARHGSFVGQKQSSLNYLKRVLEESNASETSLRQKYRNYDESLQILNAAELYNLAKPIAFEAVWLADELGDQMFETFSRNNAGLACVQTGDFSQGRAWLNQGKEKAEAINDELSRKRMTASAFLQFGYLERQAGDYEKSGRFYDEAVNLFETMEMPSSLYTAQKGKLLAFLALEKDTELERQIPITLKLIEDYREKILEEQERTSFFDNEESVYDIAADYEFKRGNYEQAYNYTEASNSRSLLDWLQRGARISGDGKKPDVFLEEKAQPLMLSEIRERMPDGVQILQYSVLENKVLIWLVSKEKFVVVPAKIQSTELREKVENYVRFLQQKDETAQAKARQIARELYDLLVSPVSNQLDPLREICLIPNKSLFYLPFAALVAPDGNPFLAKFSIFYSPSANIFLICTENARVKSAFPQETVLSIGNPAFDHQSFDLPDLPTAEAEAREIADFYDRSQTFIGQKATKNAVLDSIKSADIIHFAGHYIVVHDAPLSSYLLLAQNGKEPEESILTNSELIGEKLPRAKLIVLSACQTGVEGFYNGEGLIGLSRTFLAAGAPLIVASGWSVDTKATAELMKRFHFYRRQKMMTTVAALRNAQLEMLNDSDGRFRDPYYWAAFAAFGGYTTF